MKLILICFVVFGLFGCEDPVKHREKKTKDVKITIKECPQCPECPTCEECQVCEDSQNLEKKYCGELWPNSNVVDMVVPCKSRYIRVDTLIDGFQILRKIRCGDQSTQTIKRTDCVDCFRAKNDEEKLACRGRYNGKTHLNK